jgi:hypothetical protein
MNLKITACLAILIIACFSCKEECSDDSSLKIMMGEWYEKPVVFSEMTKLNNESSKNERFDIDINDLSEGASYYVVHNFQADCDKCVKELVKIQGYINQHPEIQNVKYIFIASAPTMVYLKEAMEGSNFQFPVFYEEEYSSFKRKNGFPLNDALYNTMLISDKRELLLFGSLFDNRKAEELYLNVFESCR